MARAKPIDVAVAGLGRSGWHIHVGALRDDARYRIVAVMDPSPERRAEAERELGCVGYEDFRAMLRGSDAELVVVATPSVHHGPQAIEALERDRHVVVEKPMCANLREADRMIRAAEKHGKRLMVHQNYRFTESFAFIREALKTKKIGRLFHIGWCNHNFARRDDWQCLQRYAGGLLNNKLIHFLDQALAIADDPVAEVLSDMRHVSDAGDAEDHVKILMRTESGITIDLEDSTAAATTRHAPPWTFLGTHGAMTIEQSHAQIRYFDPKAAPRLRVRAEPAAEGRRYGNADELPWREEAMEARAEVSGTFYDAVHASVRRGRRFPIRPEQVREMMRVIATCRKQNPQFRAAAEAAASGAKKRAGKKASAKKTAASRKAGNKAAKKSGTKKRAAARAH